MKTFTPTYLIVAALVVLAALSAWLIGANGGWLGSLAFLWTIVLGGIVAWIILHARRGRGQTRAVAEQEDSPFVGYPQDHVLGIFDRRQQATAAVTALCEHFEGRDVTVFTGPRGAAAIDSEGTAHGAGTVVQRSIEHLLTDTSDLESYDRAARAGGVVVAVRAPEEEQREQARRVFETHEGHDIYFFGALMSERLSVDTTRTTEDGSPTPEEDEEARRRRLSA